jgi:hypothetical protein
MKWLRGPEADPRRSLSWFIRLGTTRIYHRGVIEGGQGRRWFVTRCGRMLPVERVTVLPEAEGPPTFGRLCRHCQGVFR